MAAPRKIKTRFLIISDTHGARPYPEDQPFRRDRVGQNLAQHGIQMLHGFRRPLPAADVLIHCGDLTRSSGPDEYAATVALLREVDAPLKLAIPGNHDTAMDRPVWAELLTTMPRHDRHGADKTRYPARVLDMLDRARRDDGILVLDEGTYRFVLASGARLTVYATPHTPAYGFWGFQYTPAAEGGPGHDFAIPARGDVDVVMSHGPPRLVLDRTSSGEDVGCPALLARTAASRPRLHCFGHIHESWGARLVRWEEDDDDDPDNDDNNNNNNNNNKSVDLARLEDLDPHPTRDPPEEKRAKAARHNALAERRCISASLCQGDARPLEYGAETLFVNAAIMNLAYQPVHLPWLVDLELDEATEEDRRRAEATPAAIEAALDMKSVTKDPEER
ncbi:uncharacterized protein E0L32_003198 [Thyridium curvatum]|uniref:Cyclic nucleotide-binding domain-containing protein n=1 Tax=Thyridium curvatum TaxID=1093900 RepID=A0A507BK73_9PEZI|nr:uncharacterized protein E0L32_003198 [Thyridium curvatum]TPX17080.1 hypothetical protein E0L32_003198 [Thyridium curvatum]